MAWTAPTTRATGDLITAANWNTDITENLKTLGPIAYVEFTSNVAVTSSTEATPTDIVSSGAVTYEARPVLIEFFTPLIEPGNTSPMKLSLWDDATNLGWIGQVNAPGTGSDNGSSVKCERKLTPTAASHTYKISGYRNAGAANGVVYGGAGGASAFLPGFIRVTYVPA